MSDQSHSPSEPSGAGSSARSGAPQRDLSSLPAEYSASAPRDGRKRRETGRERAERYRRKRKNQFIGVIVFSVLVLAAVVLAVIVNRVTDARHAQQDPLAKNVCTDSVTPSDPQQATVNVFNMTTKTGMASDIADKFRERHFKVGAVGNYSGSLTMPGRTSVTAVVRAKSSALPQALAVQRQLPDSVFQEDEKRTSGTVDVFLIDQVPSLNEHVDKSPGGLVCK
ncbi:LytR C-terminal domain-containing protein [Arthrobacter sp. UM1]|uniref:LytR C-terminal domain-containing protein n=1 Tax=Arthrobacter sp. UM1 TaxID=2766776 RepID=UPI001CF6D79B|nr:LytR C-terminal domain-containing protein [Arthrobacter sp. UM1]MCB4209037.1 LytR C-terminal domain-containing protein [Arthrobacter sp. UM1]